MNIPDLLNLIVPINFEEGAISLLKTLHNLVALVFGTIAKIPPDVCGSNNISLKGMFLHLLLSKCRMAFLFDSFKVARIEVFSRIWCTPSIYRDVAKDKLCANIHTEMIL